MSNFDFSPLVISLRISIVAVICTFIIGLFLSYKMYKYNGRFKALFDSIINLPLVLPPVVIGFVFLIILGGNNLGQYVDIIFTWKAGVIVSVVVTLPLMYRSIIGALHHISDDIVEAGRMCGATELEIFRHIIFPIIFPGVLSGIILSFTRSLGEFGATLMVCGNIPGRTQTVSSAIYFYVSGGNYDLALTWVIIISVISFSFMLIVNKFKMPID